jgi:hypothetical protein
MALNLIPDNGVIALEPGTYVVDDTLRVLQTLDVEGLGQPGSVVVQGAEFMVRGKGNTLGLAPRPKGTSI